MPVAAGQVCKVLNYTQKLKTNSFCPPIVEKQPLRHDLRLEECLEIEIYNQPKTNLGIKGKNSQVRGPDPIVAGTN